MSSRIDTPAQNNPVIAARQLDRARLSRSDTVADMRTALAERDRFEGVDARGPYRAQILPFPNVDPRVGNGPARIDPAQLAQMREAAGVALQQCRDARADYRRDHPNERVPSDGQYTIDEILEHSDMSVDERCCRITNIIFIEHPECVQIVLGAGGVSPGQVPADVTAPEQPGQGAPQGPQMQDMLKGALGLFGGIASVVGPILANPLVAGLLTGVLGGALAATPLAPIIPFLPAIIPVAGMALTAAGGMATGASASMGGQPGQPGAAPGAQPDLFSGLLSGVTGLLGGAPPAAPGAAPAAPAPAAVPVTV